MHLKGGYKEPTYMLRCSTKNPTDVKGQRMKWLGHIQ